MMKKWLNIDYLPIPLIALMILTRYHHFGDVLHLPDASLAVFFFAGFYRKKALFAFLLVLAGLIDYLAIANGTSDWCVSPAYVFLIPTYGVMWIAGRYCLTFKTLKLPILALQLSIVALAASAAFVISNGSFYWFSGRYADVALLDYFVNTMHYYLLYLSSVLIYAAVGYGFALLIKALPNVAVGDEIV